MNQVVITEPIVIVPAAAGDVPAGDIVVEFLDGIDAGMLDQAVLDLESGYGTSPMADVLSVLKGWAKGWTSHASSATVDESSAPT